MRKIISNSLAEKNNQIGYIILALFCLLRPITLLDIGVPLFGFSVLEIFAIMMSYFLLIVVLLNLKHLELDFVSLTIILFCIYCIFSILWGSKIRVVLQILLPFVVYFTTRLFAKIQDDLSLLLSILIISFIIPIFGSFYEILRGVTVSQIDFITGIKRYSGLFSSIHIMAAACFFFSAIYYLKAIILSVKNRYINYALVLMLLISFYCIFKSYARSILLGFFILWSISLFGLNKKLFVIFLIIALITIFLNLEFLQQLFFKTNEIQIQTASSGRSYIWEHNIKLFFRYSFAEKILGRGIGVGAANVLGTEEEIWSSHNDYLHLLMHTGAMGLFLYLMIHFAIIKSVFYGNIQKTIKYFYIGFIASIIFMNFATGVITYSLSTSQLFWMIIGFMSVFDNAQVKNNM